MEGEAKLDFRLDTRLLNVIGITLLLIVSIFVWTLPFQKDKLPFGEGDSAWHFAIGDNIVSNDKAPFGLPYYVALWYGGFNKLGAFFPEYPPSNHVNYALMQVLGGERFTPVFIYRAVASFLGALAVFFFISRLFGFRPESIAGLGLSFSVRERLMYLFGQQPTVVSMVMAPIAFYSWYRYLESFYDGNPKKVYLFATVALLASQFMLHFQGFLGSVVILSVFTLAMSFKFRRVPVSKATLKSVVVALAAFLVVAGPIFYLIYYGTGGSDLSLALHLDRLWGIPSCEKELPAESQHPIAGRWGIAPCEVSGNFPADSVLFSAEYPGILPVFFFVALALLLLRLFLVKKNMKEVFLISWLVGVYLLLHFDVFSGTGAPRLTRMLIFENQLFYALIGLSAVWIPSTIASLVKLARPFSGAAKYALAGLLVVIILISSARVAYDGLKYSYPEPIRISPVQFSFAEDVLSKLPEKAFIYDAVLPGDIGQWYRQLRYPKMRWMLAVSQRHVSRDWPLTNGMVADIRETYYLFDYSDIAKFAASADPGTQQLGIALGQQLYSIEAQLFNGSQPVYNADNIRLYKYREDLPKVPT